MKKLTKYILLLIILIIILITSTFLTKNTITGNIIKNNPEYYTYTKAICDNKNYCEDYIIECQNEKEISIMATGYTIQNPKNWTDKRKKENLCKN